MPVKTSVNEKDGMYFITFTCCNWIPLFELTDSYNLVYGWFDYLKGRGHYINGYVLMPNHIHALIFFRNTGQMINTIVANGKRFLAYELISRLKKTGQTNILHQLALSVSGPDRTRGKHHQVFEPSFDWKNCRSSRFILQKLNYMHENPCRGKWKLAENAIEYPHSSALFYKTGEQGIYPVTGYRIIEDVNWLDGSA
jgi:hypothetical protein